MTNQAQSERDTAGAGAPSDFLSDLFDEIHCKGAGFAEAAYDGAWRIAPRAGDDAHGYFIESGAARLSVTGAPDLVLTAGDLVFLPPGHGHGLSGLDAAHVKVGEAVFRLDRVRARLLLRILPAVVHLPGQAGAMSPAVQPLADLIFILRREPELGGDAILKRIAEATVMRAIQHCLRTELAPTLERLGVARLAPALQVMHRQPEHDWTLAALARHAGMSRTVFAASFARALGEAPRRYLTGLRMARAEELLASGALPLAEVAARIGYGVEAFSRAFRRHAGVGPGEFRRGQRVD